MKKRNKRILIIGIILVAVIVIGVNFAGNGGAGISVNAETARIDDLVEEVSASGWVQPKNRVNITSEVTAEIIHIPVVEGQRVSRGDLLVLLDTLQLSKDLDQATFAYEEIRSRTEAAKALYLQAEEEFERQKKLYDQGLISETEFKNHEYTYRNNKYSYEAMLNQIKSSRARLEKAEDFLSKTRIIAPMDGVITYLNAEEGEIAAAQTAYTQGVTLMTISNLATFEVEVDVDETEIIKIQNGQKAKIEIDAFPDTVFNGEVVEIGNTAVMTGANAQEQSTNFKVKVLFVDSGVNIKPGMSATVDIITETRLEVPIVPYGAIVMRTLDADSLARAENNENDSAGMADNEPAAVPDSVDSLAGRDKEKGEMKEIKGVFRVREGEAEFVPVVTGIADQKNIEIVSGISAGDTVITGPFKTLRTIDNGDAVEVTMMSEFGED